MSYFKPKLVVLVLACAILPALAISACTGGEFTGSGDAGSAGSGMSSGGSSTSGGSGNQGHSGSVGTGAGTGVSCDGPEDCNDQDECTVDQCTADGTCDASPMCLGTEQCCNGGCAQCCADADCDDGVSCTDNTCFAGQCMYIPNDTQCVATEYCATKDGCRPKKVCGLQGDAVANECDDEETCTTDACIENFCKHDYCPNEGKLCCEGGCAIDCCTDSQCNKDEDPCTVGSCSEDGKCNPPVPLCAGGLECCPSADGKTATCGKCCSAEDCNDDVTCTTDQCGGGQCGHTPNDAACNSGTPGGYLCDPLDGCVNAPDCTVPGDCDPTACQSNAQCEDGKCQFDGCANGKKCCGSAGCAICCDSNECGDNVACTKDVCGPNGCAHTPDDTICPPGQPHCDARLGCVSCRNATDCADAKPCTEDICDSLTNTCSNPSTCAKGSFCTKDGCASCVYDSDCQLGVPVGTDIAIPPGNFCNVQKCVKGACEPVQEDCGDFQVCCQPYGCALSCGIIETH